MHAPASQLRDVAFAPADHGYRSDIDGLRGIAVVSVVGFHAFPKVFHSGFIGVDIFFVISGFLITSIILKGHSESRFSFITFYARRIRRIFPALILVLVACLLAGALLLWPDDYGRLGKHTAAGSGFVSNLVLWQEANYFDVASDTKILLHLWSLGIEEQFYLAWPALIWIAWRLRLNMFALFAAILVASLIYSIRTTPSNPMAAFYSPAGRFWELAAGSVLAQLNFSNPRAARLIENTVATAVSSALFFKRGKIDREETYRNFLSVIAMVVIFSSIFMIIGLDQFPGWWALLPVAGSYLAILAGPNAWLNRLLLSSPALVWIGLISYPLYLWHWPPLVFARHYYGSQPTPALVRVALIVFAVCLAWLTYRYVERPIRFGTHRRWAAPALGFAMVCIGLLGALTAANDGFPERIAEDKRAYAAYFSGATALMQAEAKDFSQNQCNFYAWDSPIPTLAPRRAIDPSCYTKHGSRSLLIIGNSNAADLYYGLNEVLPKDISVLLIYSSNCRVGPIVEADISTSNCAAASNFALNYIKADPPDVLLMSSNRSFDIDYVRKFASMVKSYGVKHVLTLGQRPHWRASLHKIVLDRYWASTPRYIPGLLDENLMSLTGVFQSQMRPEEPFEFVDEVKPFCNAEGCLAYLGESRRDGLITADSVHLRPFASVWLAQQQLAPLVLKALER